MKRFFIVLLVPGFLLFPRAGAAFQSHPAPEGLYAHQLAHLFFILAMAMLVYWLRRNRLTAQKGWRLIQVACLLFFAWNVATMAGHWVEERVPDSSLMGAPDWTQQINLSAGELVPVYYVLKLDHLVCLPAMIYLFLGIRSLYKEAVASEPPTDG